MPEQHELELYLLPNTAMSRVLVDGTEVGGVRRVSVVAEVGDVLAVTVESYRLGTPYVLRSQMLVVYDGPLEFDGPACCTCGSPAAWFVVYGNSPDDWTHACSLHLGAAVGTGATVNPL